MDTLSRDGDAEIGDGSDLAAIAKQRRWTLNGDFIGLEANGVSRYGRETTLALDALIAEGHPLARGLTLDLVAPSAPDGLRLKAIPIRIVPEWKALRLPQVWCQFQLPRHVPGGLVSFCNKCPSLRHK